MAGLMCQSIAVSNILFGTGLSTPDEEHMGSSTFGSVTPAIMIGPAMPQNIKINRAGSCRVRGDGRA
jgi:hypothetical protein